jgi:hypothetical protein
MSSTDPVSERRRFRLPILSFTALALMVALHACRHQESQAAEPSASAAALAQSPSASPSSSPPDPAGDPSAVVAAADFHEETFDLVIRPVGPYAAGKVGVAEVELTAKGGYHCNDKYPYKFKIIEDETHGLKFDSPIFTKDAVRLETMRATMKLAFTPDSKGEKTLAGNFSFSLCSAERCLVEKRELLLKISVD